MAKKGEQSGQPVVVVERDLLQSEAYLSLTGKAPQVLGLPNGFSRYLLTRKPCIAVCQGVKS